MNLTNLNNKNIHVIGLSGTEGSSLALFFIRQGLKITGHDFSLPRNFNQNYYNFHKFQSKKTSDLQIKKIKSTILINYKYSYLNQINEADIIFAPSSWFRYKENLKLKTQKLYNWYNLILEIYPGTIIGVTGTAGKGTTTHLIYNILKSAKQKSYLAGDAWQMIEIEEILNMGKDSHLVLEISNRTLTFAQQTKKSPHLAVITNITKHHLDDHQNSFLEYLKIKKEITKYQKKTDFLFYCRDDVEAKKLKFYGKANKKSFSYNCAEHKLISNKDIIGKHLTADAVVAIKVAKTLKIKQSAIIDGLNSFKARSGRMQPIFKKNNIQFINDGASTRTQATIEAIKSFPRGKVNLILEGSRPKAKAGLYTELMKVIKFHKVRNIAVSGQISNLLYPLLLRVNKSALKTNNLKSSIKGLYNLAKPGDIILLSPANESFGEFKDYRERVEMFNRIVKKLK